MIVAYALLIGILLAAMTGIAVMAAAQARRTRWLSRIAYEAGMRFSKEDIFDVFARYGDFAIIRAGHSPQAHNVTYGHYEGLPVRAFDFRYEIGHGTGRVTRTCCLLLAELEHPLPRVTLWNNLDADGPLEARRGQDQLACWSLAGDRELGRRLGEICMEAAAEALSIDASARQLMLVAPMLKKDQDYTRYFGLLSRAAGLARPNAAAPP